MSIGSVRVVEVCDKKGVRKIMIKSVTFIKHKKHLDVCFKVDKIINYGHGIKVKGTWYNMGFEHSWSLGVKETLNIATQSNGLKKESERNTLWDDWDKINVDYDGQCLREYF